MSTSLNDEHYHGSSHPSVLPLPIFTPFRDSSAASGRIESNPSGSQRSSSSAGRGIFKLSPGNATEGQYTRDDENRLPVSSRLRSSGGFLLDSGARESRLSRAFLSRSHKKPKDIKGKRKSEEPDLFVRKRRLNGAQHQNKTSIGASPLTTETKHNLDTEAIADNGRVDVEHGFTAPETSRSVQSAGVNATGGSSSHGSKNSPNTIGFDSDSAQIVNMALSLSEGRRRQASGKRYISSPVLDRHIVSTAQSAISRTPYQRVGTRYPDSNRQASRHMSLRPDTAHSRDAPSLLISEQTYPSRAPYQEIEDVDDQLKDSYMISPATIIRAQKAKDQLELIYQFRRLLSHLPPLRRPGSYVNYYDADSGSRAYNPLQYVRNRKLRFRERKPLASEDDGWHDIEQVRAWVDAVVASQQSTHHEPEECIRMPDLSQHQKPDEDLDEKDPTMLESPASSVRRMSSNPLTKPRRPRSDWIVFPGDLLADAFWLEQGLNKTKIEDRDGNAIFPPDTQFKFSGWRNRTPMQLPDTDLPPTQRRTPPPEGQGDEESASPPTAIPDLPTFSSAARPRQHSSRGRQRNTFRDALSSIPKSSNGSHSHDRRRKPRDTSASSASSGEESNARGRQRKQSTRKAREKQSVIDQHLKEMLESDDDERQTPSGQASGEASQSGSKRPSIADKAILSKLISRTSSKHPSSGKDSPQQSTSARHSADLPRNSYEGERPPRSSNEYDITAPSSPVTNGFPSIAINLSPPQSRSPSPNKKPFSSIMNPFRDRSRSQQRRGVSITDFAQSATLQATGKADSDIDPLSAPPSRGTSPMSRKQSLPPNDPRHQAPREVHRSSTVSKHSTKSSHSHHDGSGRIRGMFKGGRIAELVGTEVSRMGDFIWKRDAPNHHTHRPSTSAASILSIHTSDSEDGLVHANGHPPKTPLRSNQNRYTSAEAPGNEEKTSPSTSHSAPGSAEKPQYHISNLPSFTSPFQRDREQQEERERGLLSPETSPPSGVREDHISRLAANHRSKSHSPRLGRLAPPKLVTTSPIPELSTAQIALDRWQSYGFGGALDVTRSTSASLVFNDAINSQAKPIGVPVTGLAGLKPSNSDIGLVKAWNLSDRSLPQFDSPTAVTRRDIARTTALLKSSVVKAREISRRADEIPIPPRKFVLDTLEPSNPILHSPKLLRIARREEYRFAVENLISSLSSQTAAFRDNLRVFSQETCPVLHTDLQRLDDLVDNALTPRVRVAGDQAGELSMKLTTTSTLAVKALNDTIDGALRRRRRGPIRYLRKFGYILVEWAVVGVLWAIWLLAMLIRVAWGGVRGVYRTGKWLLFL